MKRHTSILLLVFLCIACMSRGASAQLSTGRLERVSRIPMDSIIPRFLLALDSTHLIFQGYTFAKMELWGLRHTKLMQYWFTSSDAGNSWNVVDMTKYDYLDTVVQYGTGGYIHYSYNESMSPSGKYVYMDTYGRKSSSQDWHVADWLSGSPYRLLRSSDYGESWVVTYQIDSFSQSRPFRPESVPARNHVYIVDRESGTIVHSQDYGKTFTVLPRKNVFLDEVMPFRITHGDTSKAAFGLVRTDVEHLIAYFGGVSIPLDTGLLSNSEKIGVLISSNSGGTWKKYDCADNPDMASFINDEVQYVKGTSILYDFPSTLLEGHIEYRWSRYEDERRPFERSSSYNNTSFAYSTDYGVTWSVRETDYGNRRRAYEAVSDGDVWMTVSETDSLFLKTNTSPASTIVHTTDNGETWEEDTYSLHYLEEPLDGRIISFSDSKHGWIAATHGETDCFIFRYVADDKASVEGAWEDDPNNIRQQAKIFPNPATDETKIVAPYKWNITGLEIYDMLGREMTLPITTEGSEATIDTRGLSTGCYLAIMTTPRGYKYRVRFAVVS